KWIICSESSPSPWTMSSSSRISRAPPVSRSASASSSFTPWRIASPVTSGAVLVQQRALRADRHQPQLPHQRADALEALAVPELGDGGAAEVADDELREELAGAHLAVGEDLQPVRDGQARGAPLRRARAARHEVVQLAGGRLRLVAD